MILIIILLTLFITSSPIRAQELIPYQNNPVIKKESISTSFSQPYVSKNNNIFSIWFTDGVGGRATIATMKSANGIDWYDKRNTFVTTRQNANDPFVFMKDNQYQLYFASSTNGPISLWESTSGDGITYTAGAEKEILKSQAPWEGNSLSCPSLIKENDMYYLFYAGNGVSNWGIGLATSSDGQNWQKCSNNPFIAPGSSGHIIKYNTVFYLFFQSPNGLEVQQANTLLGCNTVWTNRRAYSFSFGDPAPLVVGTDLWVYGSFPSENTLHIGLAANTTISSPSYPIVIVPGMFASWNKDAILHNTNVPFDAWIVQPAVAEYDALTKTLENKGRIKNTDYFLFAYDWRKPVEEITNNLNTFLTNKIWNSNPYEPVQIIGHSLGGLVSRIYADKNPTKPIKQIVTAGSPHLGIVQAYKPLAAGEIDRDNSLLWMAEKLVLLLNKSGLQSDKDTISQKLPVLYDMLPVFSFLKNGSEAQIASTLTNTLISHYPVNSSPPISQFYLGGSGKQTSGGYVLESRTPLDILSSSYLDGHPVSSWTEDGDGVILSKSSLNKISPAPILNHGEIIYSKESIKTILSNLNIQVQDSDIPLGKATAIFPAILAFIQSPASMQIVHNGVTTVENEGMIYLQNTEDGNYSVRVTGESSGEYTVSIWLIGATDDKWFQFKKQTLLGKTDEYSISFDGITGGNALEYVAPTSTPTQTSTSTINSQDITSASSNTSSQTTQNAQVNSGTKQGSPLIKNQTTYSPQKKNSIFSLLGTSKSANTNPEVLGASTKNKQKKNASPYGVIILLASLLTAFITYKRKTVIRWILKLKQIIPEPRPWRKQEK